jgi:hypothetical protein
MTAGQHGRCIWVDAYAADLLELLDNMSLAEREEDLANFSDGFKTWLSKVSGYRSPNL